jgi:hypothetical protein
MDELCEGLTLVCDTGQGCVRADEREEEKEEKSASEKMIFDSTAACA